MIYISIHVPTRGTTAAVRLRSHRGTISIHVPTRGTTQFPLPSLDGYPDFNPRSHEGNDGKHSVLLDPEHNFNPRSHEGNDDCMRDILFYLEISIHVPTRGTTEENTMMSRTY